MGWNRWYSLKSYIRSSLWTVPLIAVAIYAVVKPLTEMLGRWMIQQGILDPETGFFGLSMTGARSLLGDIVSADLAFLVFTFGSLLVAIQVAGGQYTPRIIATTLLRDNIIRGISGLFVFTLLFANRTAGWMGEEEVHQFQVFIAALFGFASVVAFLFLIDYAAKFLRPVSLVARVGEQGLAVVDSVYPAPSSGVAVNGVAIPQSAMDSAVSTAVSRGNDVDTPQLRAALKQQLIIREVVRQQAARAHYDQRPEVQQASDAEKVDVEIQSWLQDNVHAQEPTERQIRARYNNVNAELGKYEYKPQYIVLADQAVAKGVIAQAKAGKPFDALARKFSIVPSKENGGEMPWVSFKTPVVEGKTRGVPVEVARALAKLPVGGVVQQPLQSGQAWVVVRLEDKRPMSVPSFDTVKDQIRRQMIAESMDAGAAKLVKSLVQSATIVQ